MPGKRTTAATGACHAGSMNMTNAATVGMNRISERKMFTGMGSSPSHQVERYHARNDHEPDGVEHILLHPAALESPEPLANVNQLIAQVVTAVADHRLVKTIPQQVAKRRHERADTVQDAIDGVSIHPYRRELFGHPDGRANEYGRIQLIHIIFIL